MKTNLRLTLLIAAAVVAGSNLLAVTAQPSSVTVSFHESDKFTDVRAHFGGSTDEHYLSILSEHLVKTAGRLLAPGQKLEVTFSDIDLAGDFMPASTRSQDVRIIKEIYIPRQTLSFKLLDADGKVVKEGERRLSDLNFMDNIRIIGRNDPLFHDKALLTDWIEKEFKK